MPAVTNPKDPTNQAKNRKSAKADFRRRLIKIKKQVTDLFNEIPRQHTRQSVISNSFETIWKYEITEFLLDQLLTAIMNLFNTELETEGTKPPFNWWYTQYNETAYRAGMTQENSNIAQLVAGVVGVAALTLFDITNTTEYRTNLDNEVADSYRTMRSIADRNAERLMAVLQAGMKDGKPPKLIIADMVQKFNIAWSDAKRFVDTEINRINNNSRTNLVIYYRDTFDLNLAVVHISALLATTRLTHADRHSLVYTPEQQNQWWSQGSNRINCHCSVRSVLLDDDGQVMQQNFVEKLKKQRKFFEN